MKLLNHCQFLYTKVKMVNGSSLPLQFVYGSQNFGMCNMLRRELSKLFLCWSLDYYGRFYFLCSHKQESEWRPSESVIYEQVLRLLTELCFLWHALQGSILHLGVEGCERKLTSSIMKKFERIMSSRRVGFLVLHSDVAIYRLKVSQRQ